MSEQSTESPSNRNFYFHFGWTFCEHITFISFSLSLLRWPILFLFPIRSVCNTFVCDFDAYASALMLDYYIKPVDWTDCVFFGQNRFRVVVRANPVEAFPFTLTSSVDDEVWQLLTKMISSSHFITRSQNRTDVLGKHAFFTAPV